jgi:DNA-directed RNA polymerase specialized sigma24 family protein
MAVMRELGSLRLCTIFMCQRSGAFPSQRSAVNVYAPAETSSLVDAAPFFRLVVRDVARELQAMPAGMRQAVVFAAVSIGGYNGMAARLKVDPGTFRSRLSRGRQRFRRKFASAAAG